MTSSKKRAPRGKTILRATKQKLQKRKKILVAKVDPVGYKSDPVGFATEAKVDPVGYTVEEKVDPVG